jgi:hypothetical protein
MFFGLSRDIESVSVRPGTARAPAGPALAQPCLTPWPPLVRDSRLLGDGEPESSAGPALRPCGSSTATRFGRRRSQGMMTSSNGESRNRAFVCLRRGKAPRRWKIRRAGERALRYSARFLRKSSSVGSLSPNPQVDYRPCDL